MVSDWLELLDQACSPLGATEVLPQSSHCKYMMGRLSDRPMMRAASIPHLGQTTPTAAVVRLGMNLSYLSGLDV
jgi:hypothetical protein